MPLPYNYHFNEHSKFYYFITKNKIEYRVAFIIDETFSAISDLEINNIYQIVIEKVTDELEKLDMQVSATIQSIILKFFTNSQNSMIYVCDDKDKKGSKRFNVFNRWYEKSGFINEIKKKYKIIHFFSNDQNINIYSSLLYHHNNKNKQMIIEVYNTIQQILNEK